MNGNGAKKGHDFQLFPDCVIVGGSCACADVDGINGITIDDVPILVGDLVSGSTCPQRATPARECIMAKH
jgi:hypothetical protein